MEIHNIKLSRKVYRKNAPLEYSILVSRKGVAEFSMDGRTIELIFSAEKFLKLEERFYELGLEQLKPSYLIHDGEHFCSVLEITFEDGTIKTITEDSGTFFGQLQAEIIGKMIRFKIDLNVFPEGDYDDAVNLCVFNNELDVELKVEQFVTEELAF